MRALREFGITDDMSELMRFVTDSTKIMKLSL